MAKPRFRLLYKEPITTEDNPGLLERVENLNARTIEDARAEARIILNMAAQLNQEPQEPCIRHIKTGEQFDC